MRLFLGFRDVPPLEQKRASKGSSAGRQVGIPFSGTAGEHMIRLQYDRLRGVTAAGVGDFLARKILDAGAPNHPAHAA